MTGRSRKETCRKHFENLRTDPGTGRRQDARHRESHDHFESPRLRRAATGWETMDVRTPAGPRGVGGPSPRRGSTTGASGDWHSERARDGVMVFALGRGRGVTRPVTPGPTSFGKCAGSQSPPLPSPPALLRREWTQPRESRRR